MPKGTVKWFNSQKGYGFIQPQSGGKDVFVHISAVERAGLSGLNEGQVVEYEEVSDKGKTSAENLKVQRWPAWHASPAIRSDLLRPYAARVQQPIFPTPLPSFAAHPRSKGRWWFQFAADTTLPARGSFVLVP